MFSKVWKIDRQKKQTKNETIYSVNKKQINDLNKTNKKKKQLNKIKIMNSVSFFHFDHN